MRLTAQDLREMNILKYYRLTRKWVCKTYGLKDADLELLIYLDCKGRFTRNDFINGVYTYSWDKARWDRLRSEGWIDVWRHRNRTTIMYSVFKTSFNFFVEYNFLVLELKMKKLKHIYLILLNPKY